MCISRDEGLNHLLSHLCCCAEVQSVPGAALEGSVSAAGPGAMVQAVLQALKLLVTCPLSRQEKSRGAWRRLLRSALSTLLGLWEPGRDHRHGRLRQRPEHAGQTEAEMFAVSRRAPCGPGQPSHGFDRVPAVCGRGRLQP